MNLPVEDWFTLWHKPFEFSSFIFFFFHLDSLLNILQTKGKDKNTLFWFVYGVQMACQMSACFTVRTIV